MGIIDEVIPKVENPCRKDCPERCITCHSTCEKYFKFQEYNQKMSKKKSQISNLYSYKGKVAQT